MTTGPETETERDAERYRRLRVLGCAPAYTQHLTRNEVLRFTNLDAFVDEDIAAYPSRGEAKPGLAPCPDLWRPIESAPKDGTEVLVWCDEGMDIARYSEREEDGVDSMGHDSGWWGMRQPMDPGRSMGNPDYRRPAENQPWAWMPQPEPPYDDEGERLFASPDTSTVRAEDDDIRALNEEIERMRAAVSSPVGESK